MVWAEFEEKEYECAFDIELADGALGTVFSSGQVLEEIVGYDVAADVDRDHTIWQILSVPRPPGVRLVPHLWRPGREPHVARLPSRPVSLILQYKRPEFLAGTRAKQWKLWHRPYFRFTRSKDQQMVLNRVERRLANEVTVRYVAPAFHLRSELEANQTSGQIISRSGFVAPSILVGHLVWTYVEPGTVGMANPNGRTQDFETAEVLRSLLAAHQRDTDLPVRAADSWRDHLARLGQAALYREPELRRQLSEWADNVRRALRIEEETLTAIHAVAAVRSILARHNGAWFLTDPTGGSNAR